MTLGEKILYYRKELGMSQEELGQKLLVSRQTVSLWEKGQTVPTIDNLIRLKEIFGVSLDDVLGGEDVRAQINPPKEAYKFNFSRDELRRFKAASSKPAFILLSLIAAITAISMTAVLCSSASGVWRGISIAAFAAAVIALVSSIILHRNLWKKDIDRITENTYEHKIFDDSIVISVFHGNEKTREYKFSFGDVENLTEFDAFISAEIGGRAFIIRKSNLAEDSYYLSRIRDNKEKTQSKAENKMYKNASTALIIACAIAALLGGIGVVAGWIRLICLIPPLASIFFGIKMKSKGVKFTKNIVAGIIAIVIFGVLAVMSAFFVPELYEEDDVPVPGAEEINITIAEYELDYKI